MDTTLPDAFGPPQTSFTTTKTPITATTEAAADESSSGIKVEGMLVSCGVHPADKIRSLIQVPPTDDALIDTPKFDLESYIANYTGQ